MKYTKLLLAIIIIITSSCSDKAVVRTTINGFAQGTTYNIVIISDKIENLQPQIDSIFNLLDNSFSLYNPSSLLSKINRNETDSLDEFIAECITQAEEISVQSNGLYDITVKPLVKAYGFAEGKPTLNPNIDSLIQFVGYEKIKIENAKLIKSHQSVEIDLNSIAQGFSADYIGKYLLSLGIENFLVEVGSGEIYARGSKEEGKPWVIGIDEPFEGNVTPGANLIATIKLTDCGMATSGNYRKKHTINPTTGKIYLSDILSATIVAENSTLSDAYGTMFMVMGFDKSKAFLDEHPELGAFLVYADKEGNTQTYSTEKLKSLITTTK